ncbi:sigma-70 family RNA polymerase sigma factor [Gordonia pseudamarae]|jgi:RNA polymerase sigma-70 factor (ECF subfamily)|uniref:Sigma-70 family RNA polymerase sigma factor n=1 Tax=Gordonia pseudamarae TaxID=2831662 RepID=A0ABX6IIP7_9ACTN|nr:MULTISPECIES: sigma-70 family RNA polymerase sigma factor [Gordonia]MBD0022563.1 sigma-70 family RNA polymerase sigma factor [Gordonia sp. (in: high G+C Gram-positive bacteria)]QHN26869.1 sigma-70 family RNA polymerase sigma factor [Gordonia pseudamarae]QHN35760.1 sigma-70 family RNA polymerase sigma factor [Gordonia pseudamarae]
MTVVDELQADRFRTELIGYCYRYFASYAEAEDAVQETLTRAWQHADEFRDESSLRTWLYRIATNICLDMAKAPQRRTLPMDLSGPGAIPDDPTALTTLPEATWVGPIADAALTTDPADATIVGESIRLAFITALQVLPPRQRVVLILRDVLGWSAQESAKLLGFSVASVNSALARARKTLSDASGSDASGGTRPVSARDPAQRRRDQELLTAYVAAFRAYDVDRLVELLAEDATFSMPPFELWLHGIDNIERWWRGPGQVCRNSRTIVTAANGQPAVAVYHDNGTGLWLPFAIHVLDTSDDAITGITHFMGIEVFDQFGLPESVVEE